MTSEAPKLLPCPFCGNTHLINHKGHSTSYIKCKKCRAYGPDEPYEGAWNTRDTTHAQAMVAAERKACASTAFRACKSVKSGYRDENERLARRIENELRLEVVKAIRARTTAEERAALDALLKAERVKAWRKAADCIGHITRAEDHEAILALIEKETGQ